MAFNLLLKAQLERVINKIKPLIRTYATSSTAKDTVNKVVFLNGFILGTGAKVTVKFTDTSTTSPSSGNITLNVNSTGAKTVISSIDGSTCTYEDADYFCDNKTQQFIYDGTNWVWLKNGDSEGIEYTAGNGINIDAQNVLSVKKGNSLEFNAYGNLQVNYSRVASKSYVQRSFSTANNINVNEIPAYSQNGITMTNNSASGYFTLSGTATSDVEFVNRITTYSSVREGKYALIVRANYSNYSLSSNGIKVQIKYGNIVQIDATSEITFFEITSEQISSTPNGLELNFNVFIPNEFIFPYEIEYTPQLVRIFPYGDGDISESDLLISTTEFEDLT